MNEEDIRKYAAIMQQMGLTGLEIKEDNRVVRLERNIPERSLPEQMYHFIPPAPPIGVPLQENSAGVEKEGDYISVKSPIVGVFYASSAENAEPYVSVGDSVTKGQTLCIIEAMKLMNEITADEEGTIAKICVTNGQVVEYGTELFQIKKG